MRYWALVFCFASSAFGAGLDPWHPPVAGKVIGLNLSDGWYDPRILAANVDGGWTDSAQISGDGRYLRFTYSQYDFPTWFSTNQQVIAGPSLLGQAAPFKNFGFDVVNNVVELLPGNPADASTLATSPTINTSGDVYVQSWWPRWGLPARLMLSLKANGTWSTPSELPYPVNSPSPGCYADNAYVAGTQSSFRLYFDSERVNAGGTTCWGQRRVWRSDYTANGGFSQPVLVSGLSTTTSDDSQFSISPDGATAYWTSIRNGAYGIFAGTVNGNGSLKNVHAVATISSGVPYTGKIALIGEATVAQSGTIQLLYFMCGIAQDASATMIKLSVCVARKGLL